MKKSLLIGALLAATASIVQAKNMQKPIDFSGSWVLDASQTKRAPQGLESYTMTVKQNERQLEVRTALKGDLRQPLPDVMSGPRPVARGPIERYPDSSPRGMGMPRIGGTGIPSAGGSGPMSERIPVGGMPGSGGGAGGQSGAGGRDLAIVALKFYPSHAVFQLDGHESTAKLGGPTQASATLKANWEKGGKELKLSVEGDDNSDERGAPIQLKDAWRLSKDGQTLKIKRTVQTRRGSSTFHLVFHKREPASSGSRAS